MKKDHPHRSSPYRVGPLGLANIALALVLVFSGTGGLSYLVLKATVGQPLPADLTPFRMHLSLLMLMLPTALAYGLLRAVKAHERLRTNLANQALLAAGNAVLALPVLTRSLLEVAPALLWTVYANISHYLGQVTWSATAVLVLTLSAVVFRSAKAAAVIEDVEHEPLTRLTLAALLVVSAGYLWLTLLGAAGRGRFLASIAEANPATIKTTIGALALSGAAYALLAASKSARAWTALAAFTALVYSTQRWSIVAAAVALIAVLSHVQLARWGHAAKTGRSAPHY